MQTCKAKGDAHSAQQQTIRVHAIITHSLGLAPKQSSSLLQPTLVQSDTRLALQPCQSTAEQSNRAAT